MFDKNAAVMLHALLHAPCLAPCSMLCSMLRALLHAACMLVHSTPFHSIPFQQQKELQAHSCTPRRAGPMGSRGGTKENTSQMGELKTSTVST